MAAVLLVLLFGAVAIFLFPGQQPPRAAAVDVASFSFTAFGDSGYGGDTITNMQAAGLSGAAFHLQLGDLSYGATSEQNWCDTFRQLQPNVFVVTGNHDSHESGGGDMENYKVYCPFTFAALNTGSGLTGSGYGYEYYFDYPTGAPFARIIMTCAGVELQNVAGGTCIYTPGSQRYTWLANAIDEAKNNGWWVIVGSHKEYVSTGPYGGDGGQEYYDLLLEKKVDLVLMGHDHTYQRTKQLICCIVESTGFNPGKVVNLGPAYVRGAGTVNIISGTGGWGLYTIDTADPDNQYFATWNGDNIGGSYGFTKVTVTASSITGVFVPVTGAFTDTWSIGGTPPPPGQLSADFAFTPSVVRPGDTATFTATINGGTPAYSADWTFGDGTSSTGISITHSYGSEGTFTVTLLVTDALGATVAVSHPVSVTSGSSVPVIVGWGGPKGDESSLSSGYLDPSNPPSLVFSGEQASNFEIQAVRLEGMGFNAIRFSFAPGCTNPDGGFMYPYSPENLERAIRIAERFDLWIIVDYHGYDDLSTTSLADCWVNFWGPVVQQFKDRYSKIVWEPLNEPTNLPGGDNVLYLGEQYQRWIVQARGLGDQHWIVVQNLCSFSCGLSDMADGFPTVADPLGRVFISLHSYVYYPGYANSWSNATAESVAQSFYQAVVDGMASTGWPALSTEGGTDPLCRACAPDTILDGSAGYTAVTFHFIQTLTNLYDQHSPQRINWIWWPMASWTDTPNSRPYGALQCGSNPEAWGCLLQYQPVTSIGNHPPILSVPPTQSVSETNTMAFTVTATDPDNGQTVTISTSGLPNGATFDSASGGFAWLPSEAQGPGDYTVSFIASDNGSPSLSDTKSVLVHVNEVNLNPVLAPIGNKNTGEETSLSFTSSATDPDLPANTLRYSLAPGAPLGASINPATGTFTWTPTEAQGPGVYMVTIVVTDNGAPALSDSETIQVTVSEVNKTPIITPIGDRAVAVGDTLTFTVTSTDSDIPADATILSATGLVASMSFDPTTGVFSFMPTVDQDGQTFPVTFRATDDGVPSLFMEITVNITVQQNPAPILDQIGDKTVHEESLLSFTATATDSAPANLPLTFSCSNCASIGASITLGGMFSWTASEAQGPGTYIVTIIVTDSLGASDSETIQITINEVNVAHVLEAIGSKSVDEKTTLSFAATAADADIPANTLIFSLDVGAPAGASIDPATGVFMWTPTEAQGPGVYLITVRITDNGSPSLSDFETIQVTVNEVSLAPVLGSIGNQSVDEETLLSFTATATDPDIPANVLTFFLGPGAPAGTSIAAGGLFTWTPGEVEGPGTHSLTIMVSDGSLTDSETIMITVTEVNTAPTLNLPGPQAVAVGDSLTFTVSGTDPDVPANTLTFSVMALVQGMTFEPGSGQFAIIPTQDQTGQTFTVAFTATDNGSPSLFDTGSVQIAVLTAANRQPVFDPIPDTSVDEETLLAFTVTATDPDMGQVLAFSVGPGVPAGVSMTVDGVFTWTPVETQGPGTYAVALTVSDGFTSTTATFTISVGEVNEPPVVTIPETLHVREGDVLSFGVNVTDLDVPSNEIMMSVSGVPEGASFDPASGIFYWNLSTVQPGVYYVSFTATDNGTPTYSDTKTLTIHANRGEGRCFICEILPSLRSFLGTDTWLLSVGGLMGLTVSLSVYFYRARARLARARGYAARSRSRGT